LETLINFKPDEFIVKKTIEELIKISSGECAVCGEKTVIVHRDFEWGDIDDFIVYSGPALECYMCESITFIKDYNYKEGAVLGYTINFLLGSTMIDFFGGKEYIQKNIDLITCYAILMGRKRKNKHRQIKNQHYNKQKQEKE
jgi:hypothetical protein